MVENQNKEILNKISEETKIANIATLPRNLNNSIQPVLDVSSFLSYVSNAKQLNLSDSASNTIMTTASDKDTYITAVQLTVTKDVVNDGIFSNVAGQLSDSATSINLCILRYEPTTAGQFHIHVTFPIPLKMKRGTNIVFTHGAATASIDGTAIVYYHEVDTLTK